MSDRLDRVREKITLDAGPRNIFMPFLFMSFGFGDWVRVRVLGPRYVCVGVSKCECECECECECVSVSVSM